MGTGAATPQRAMRERWGQYFRVREEGSKEEAVGLDVQQQEAAQNLRPSLLAT